ncbi:hypothetical protein MOQ_008276 [Trypanosoma cruzi marinkellei]|uniref:Uncharacterized protein n=1 Tax=Trypanosoma cruzi marinkellei TaxID=85056 RepID=K2MLF5_TRYCR|nr:hypothetical protein MOQ_008276 [Trypanosoma cruzi marinkellei]
MESSRQPRNTRIVDLGRMSREEVIEIAKKQARSIREKSTRINTLEELVEQLTGRPAPDAGAAALNSSLTSVGSPPPVPSEHRSELAPQQNIEEERMAYATEISRNEEIIRTLQAELNGKTEELTALQEKVNAWKEKVTIASCRDQEMIAELQSRLEQQANAGTTSFFPTATPATIPPDVLERAVREKLSSWQERVKTKMREDMDRIRQLEEQLESIQKLQKMTAAEELADKGQNVEPPQSLAQCPQTSDSVPRSEELTEDVIEHAVQQRVEQWKERVKETIYNDRKLIQELQQELQALRSASTESQISFEAPTEVVNSIGRAAVTEVKQLQKNMAFQEANYQKQMATLTQEVQRLERELEEARQERERAVGATEAMQRDAVRERDEAVATLTQEVQRLERELEEARQERERAVGATEAMQRDAVRERDEAVATLTQEVQRLERELEEARRERVVVSGDKNCLACVSKDARMGEWKKSVKLIIERSDEEKKMLAMELASSKEGAHRAQLEFTERVDFLRCSMSSLQAELLRLVEERKVMAESLSRLEEFKAMVVRKIMVK